MTNEPLAPCNGEQTANALMAVFGLKPAFKVFQAKGSWYVAKYQGGVWQTLPRPWLTEGEALASVPKKTKA